MNSFIKSMVWIVLIAVCLCPGAVSASDAEESETAWYEKINSEWGGQLRAGGSASWHQEDSYYLVTGDNPFLDGFLETRIKNKTFWTDRLYTDVHYELVLSGFDTRAAEQELQNRFGDFAGAYDEAGPVSDDRRLFDLTEAISEDDRYILYHRLDWAYISISPSWGLIRLGRQAVTWGNGFLFNPMDLLNPFAPTDIIRDYKMGDDMALFQTRLPRVGELQLLYVPRRNPLTDRVEWDSSSLGGKLHLAKGTFEFDIMAARHYDDYVIGAGIIGYLGNAAWRMDATYTFLEGPASSEDGFFSFVGNLDYSWIWGGKNFYGLLEFYYNGLGNDDYGQALLDPELADRVARGELFTLGRAYLAGRINMEVHPLFNVYVTAINNVEDPSGVIQTYAVADLMQDLQLTVGAAISYGDRGTEYGGFYLPGSRYLVDSPESVYFWLTYYF